MAMTGGVIAYLLARGETANAAGAWPRSVVGVEVWRDAIDALDEGEITLSGLWGEPGIVRMALISPDFDETGVLVLPCPNGRFPSVAVRHRPAMRLERTLADLVGLVAEGAPDPRPWLDHGRWPAAHPLGAAGPAKPAAPYVFLPAVGESLHQIPVGPVHAGVIEPGHFRFTVNGETIVRLEARLGYVHRGLEARMTGAPIALAARLAGRASGDSTVAYAVAFARAVEAALDVRAPPRAHWLRGLMAEFERLANHIGDIGAICNDASFGLMHAHTGVLRERVLRACAAAFGHRLMMDRVVAGGVNRDLDAAGVVALRGVVAELRQRFPTLVDLYDDTASLQDRTVGAGRLTPELARAFGAGGYVGRASGRGFDARRALAYPPYAHLRFDVPIREAGDVDARVWLRIEEVRQSLNLIEQMLAAPAGGAVLADLPADAAGDEGVAMVEGFRGDILAWVRLDGAGHVARVHLRDPSWFQWPLLEACIEGNIVADFPLCNKSFNCSYAGCDL